MAIIVVQPIQVIEFMPLITLYEHGQLKLVQQIQVIELMPFITSYEHGHQS